MASSSRPHPPVAIIAGLVKARPGELPLLLWSCAYFFCLLSGYYILRPLRDTLGIEQGIDNLKWLYLATVGASFVVHPLYGALVARFSRRTFIPLVYRFFMLNLVILFVLLKALPDRHFLVAGRIFFVWLSVFNLFVVSVFWSFMADTFTSEQAKRLFGAIAVGGTFGGVCGSLVTRSLAGVIDPINLMLVSVVLLEAACRCVFQINRRTVGAAGSIPTAGDDAPVRGGAWAGIRLAVRSPYLLGICLIVLSYTMSSTWLYFIQADLVDRAIDARDDRVAFFAGLDLLTNGLTMAVQVFLTGRVMTRLGVAVALAAVPAITLLGCAVLVVGLVRPEMVSALAILAVMRVLRRTANFAFTRPAREVLFTVVSREEKYKAKNLVDTVLTRGGDLTAVWLLVAGLRTLPSAVAAALVAAAAIVASVWLGTEHRGRADARRGEGRGP